MAKSAIKDSIQQDQINFLKEGKKEDSSILRFALSFINKDEPIFITTVLESLRYIVYQL